MIRDENIIIKFNEEVLFNLAKESAKVLIERSKYPNALTLGQDSLVTITSDYINQVINEVYQQSIGSVTHVEFVGMLEILKHKLMS